MYYEAQASLNRSRTYFFDVGPKGCYCCTAVVVVVARSLREVGAYVCWCSFVCSGYYAGARVSVGVSLDITSVLDV